MTFDSRYRALDLWRGLACLMVVVFHSTIWVVPDRFAIWDSVNSASTWALAVTSTFHHGVTLFFVISGYCIAATALSTCHQRGGLVTFLRRRARRILPPYWIALLGTIIFVELLKRLGIADLVTGPVPGALPSLSTIADPVTLNRWQWIGNLSLTEFWRTNIVWRGGQQFVLGQSWTLNYEEQFYSVMAVLVALSAGKGARLFLGSAAVTLAVLMSVQASLPVQGLFLDGMWLLFAMGVWVFYDLTQASRFVRALGRTVLAIPMAAWCLGEGDPTLAIGSVFALTLLALRRVDSMASLRILRPLAWAGTGCYSLYLVHWPLTKLIGHAMFHHGWRSPLSTLLVTTPLALVASSLVAWLFHVQIERRFLNGPQPSAVTAYVARRAGIDLRVAQEQTAHTGR